MSDNTPPDTGKPASKPRKSAPRRRKPTAKADAPVNEPVVAAPAAIPAKAGPTPTAGTSAPSPRVLIRTPLNVRWRDLDAFNHVNNSKYLSYLEEARLQWMLTMPGQGLDDHVAPVVAAANLNYRRPIEWPNEVMVELFVERLGTTSVSIGHRILARDDASVLYCDGNVVMVWIDRGTGAAAPLPAEVRAACG
ncbi:YbgC/YbaW family acyl-CoA thioester hydrolase [Lysobacter ruishenii]|uniref:YbgC/YbaW family acyl-CoA thioester hydrolase n=1 Tax=Aerolutibacter ruishenii TaxID=686800 RepID=A0A562LSM5_9GAMM|nr:YbgC/YbaW family acyl-CoA thioester hydrolase [Lysobacter ruishenii]